MQKKIAVALLVLAVTAGAASAQVDMSRFPSPIEPGNILLSPGFSIIPGSLTLGGSGYSMSINTFGIGGALAVDYALPIPLTVGAEVGFENYHFSDFGGDFELGTIPIMFRIAWHPNFGVQGLDPYILGKGGIGIPMQAKVSSGGVSVSTDLLDLGFGFGVDAGVRYFFTDMIGAFGELGYQTIIYTISGIGGGSETASLGGFAIRLGVTIKF
jgi:hypothetical protein